VTNGEWSTVDLRGPELTLVGGYPVIGAYDPTVFERLLEHAASLL
jgi:hypothetical protein